MRLYRAALAGGEALAMSEEMALSHFTGLMLNVPRLINEGRLPGPGAAVRAGGGGFDPPSAGGRRG